MASLTYRQLLSQNRPFRALWIGQVISELGNGFNFVAGLGILRLVSNADPFAAGLLIAMQTAPFAVCAPLAGVFVDRWSRWKVLLAADLGRAFVALGFFFIRSAEDIWIAYVCSILLSALSAFFEAAKNASLPNVAGEDGLLAANALMFSSRFLLMSVGSALGGWAAAEFGYQIAFLINALSFIASAYSVWVIPPEVLHKRRLDEVKKDSNRVSAKENLLKLGREMREGAVFIGRTPFVLTFILINIVWATGGGALNLISERLGGVVYAQAIGWNADSTVGVFYFAAGAGLFVGMMLVRRVGDYVIAGKKVISFIGWSMIVSGILLISMGLFNQVFPVLLAFFASRMLLGVSYGVQETLMMKAIPDHLRGRVMTIDRAAELSIFSIMGAFFGWSLNYISPQSMTMISGFLSGLAGILWFIRMRYAPSDEAKN